MPDPRLSDEATGLPPLEELGDDPVMLVLAWATGDGIAANEFTNSDEPCRFLHLRGLVRGPSGGQHDVEWAQLHIAVPVEAVMDIAAALVKGYSLGPGRSG